MKSNSFSDKLTLHPREKYFKFILNICDSKKKCIAVVYVNQIDFFFSQK